MECQEKDVAKIYTEICANCHGTQLEGGQAPSMLDDQWSSGTGDDASLARIIRDGSLEKGMPAFNSLMNEGDIRAMVIFIREQRASYRRNRQEYYQRHQTNETLCFHFKLVCH